MVYDKEFLIDAFLFRYSSVVLDCNTREQGDKFMNMVYRFYDEVGKDKFRVYCGLDAEAIRKFRLATGY